MIDNKVKNSVTLMRTLEVFLRKIHNKNLIFLLLGLFFYPSLSFATCDCIVLTKDPMFEGGHNGVFGNIHSEFSLTDSGNITGYSHTETANNVYVNKRYMSAYCWISSRWVRIFSRRYYKVLFFESAVEDYFALKETSGGVPVFRLPEPSKVSDLYPNGCEDISGQEKGIQHFANGDTGKKCPLIPAETN
ncbi:MAG: hypothetical protein OEY01_15610 [Desulfobulbaceae bacterium]|nr:hypothetical protein [Desulfobulbaceae bacterium]